MRAFCPGQLGTEARYEIKGTELRARVLLVVAEVKAAIKGGGTTSEAFLTANYADALFARHHVKRKLLHQVEFNRVPCLRQVSLALRMVSKRVRPLILLT